MRWLIAGARGQLGVDLQRVLAARPEAEVHAFGSADLDITDRAAIERALADLRPEVVVNCAAFTAVDRAEAEPERAYAVNAAGPALLAAAVARTGAKLVQLSTDYVFAGTAAEPYSVSATPDPQSVYGQTKLAGERAVRELAPALAYVVRTSWVYGAHGNNFVKTMLRLEGSRDTLSVVDDQTGSPTWTVDLAGRLVDLVLSGQPAGTYHCRGGGSTTWCRFAQAIFTEVGADPARVRPIRTVDYPTPAPRPAYSVLSDGEWAAAGLPPMRPWRQALAAAFAADRVAYQPAVSS